MEDMKHFAEAVHPQRCTCAARGTQKKPSLRAGREENHPALYAVYFRKHRRTDFLLLYPGLHYIAASREHAPRRRHHALPFVP
jgi:hypothetical protein